MCINYWLIISLLLLPIQQWKCENTVLQVCAFDLPVVSIYRPCVCDVTYCCILCCDSGILTDWRQTHCLSWAPEQTSQSLDLCLQTFLHSRPTFVHPLNTHLYSVLSWNYTRLVPSVLWRCWLGGWRGIRPVKNFGVVLYCNSYYLFLLLCVRGI